MQNWTILIFRSFLILLLFTWLIGNTKSSQGFQQTEGLTVTFLQQLDNTAGNLKVVDVAWSYDGKYLASAEIFGNIHIWNSETGELVTSFACGYRDIQRLAWSPIRLTLAVGCSSIEESPQIETVDNQITLIKFNTSDQPVEWLSNGTQLAVAQPDDTVAILDVGTLMLLYTLGSPYVPPTAGAEIMDGGPPLHTLFKASPDDQYLGMVRRGQATAIDIWDLNTKNIIRNFPYNYSDIAWLQGGDTFAIIGSETRSDALQIWDTESTTLITELSGSAYIIESSTDGNYLVYCGGGQLHALEAGTWSEIPIYNANAPGEPIDCFAHDLALSSTFALAMAEDDGTMRLGSIEETNQATPTPDPCTAYPITSGDLITTTTTGNSSPNLDTSACLQLQPIP